MADQDQDWANAGQQLRDLRLRAGLSIDQAASRAGAEPAWWAELEDGVGTTEVSYHRWLQLVRATQPPRPPWWDEGYEHDLHLGEQGIVTMRSGEERSYWDRIAAVRAEIRRNYEHGRSDTAAS